jgi:hypothetical protein
MRALRLSLAGTVILVLLAGPGGGVEAEDEEEAASDRPHQVSGTLQWAGSFEPDTTSIVEAGRYLKHGGGGRYTIEMDDDRLSGTLWYVRNKDILVGPVGPDGEVQTGTVELVGDDGSWVGTMRGHVAYEELGRHYHLQFELTGTEACAGLSTLLIADGQEERAWDVDGFVFPGVLPPYPDPVVPAAD